MPVICESASSTSGRASCPAQTGSIVRRWVARWARGASVAIAMPAVRGAAARVAAARYELVEAITLHDMPRMYGIVAVLVVIAFAVNALLLRWEHAAERRATGSRSR